MRLVTMFGFCVFLSFPQRIPRDKRTAAEIRALTHIHLQAANTQTRKPDQTHMGARFWHRCLPPAFCL